MIFGASSRQSKASSSCAMFTAWCQEIWVENLGKNPALYMGIWEQNHQNGIISDIQIYHDIPRLWETNVRIDDIGIYSQERWDGLATMMGLDMFGPSTEKGDMNHQQWSLLVQAENNRESVLVANHESLGSACPTCSETRLVNDLEPPVMVSKQDKYAWQ